MSGADAEGATLMLGAMVDELASSPERHLSDPRWEAAFRRVPRHRFLSGFYVDSEDLQRRWEYVDPATDTERWLRLVYSDDLRVTRIDEYERPLSSTSMPRMMARFLDLLNVGDESTVLEIGSGTGYNTAVLCERLGSENVTSVDIDGALVATARIALAGCGYTPVVAVADGRRGYPARAPYDRIVSTASTSRIPPGSSSCGSGG